MKNPNPAHGIERISALGGLGLGLGIGNPAHGIERKTYSCESTWVRNESGTWN